MSVREQRRGIELISRPMMIAIEKEDAHDNDEDLLEELSGGSPSKPALGGEARVKGDGGELRGLLVDGHKLCAQACRGPLSAKAAAALCQAALTALEAAIPKALPPPEDCQNGPPPSCRSGRGRRRDVPLRVGCCGTGLSRTVQSDRSCSISHRPASPIGRIRWGPRTSRSGVRRSMLSGLSRRPAPRRRATNL